MKLVLVALKCDLRDDEGTKERLDKFGEKCITYEQGLATAKNIKAVRYLGTYLKLPLLPSHTTHAIHTNLVECSAKHNRGVLEAFTEASRVSLTARAVGGDSHVEEKSGERCGII